ARIRGPAIAGPAFGRQRERLLGGLLGEVEVAEEADQGGEDAPPLVPEGALELVQRSTRGLTSTAPPMRAAGYPGRLGDGEVLAQDGLLLILGEGLEPSSGVGGIDLEQVLHGMTSFG